MAKIQATATNFTLDSLLAAIPDRLRMPLVSSFREIEKQYFLGHWEQASLKGGKFCEIVFTIIKGFIDSSFPSKPQKPANFVDACRQLEKRPPTGKPGDRSVRVLIPRTLLSIYEVRNNRGVGHAGAEVDPNHMDATLVFNTAKWVLAELIRIFAKSNPSEASVAVELLSERVVPAVWTNGTVKRVLMPQLKALDKTLLLLYSEGKVNDAALSGWVEYSNTASYRIQVLSKAHEDKLVEYDKNTGLVEITPLGAKYVEGRGLLGAI